MGPNDSCKEKRRLSAVALPLISLALGEPGVVRLTPLSLGSLVYQGVIVAFAGYLIWFWLLTRDLAGRLAVFRLLTPLAGVAFDVLLLGERLTPVFGVGALLVGVGIVMLNAPRATACDQHGISSSMSAIDEAGSAADAGLLAGGRAAARGTSLPLSDSGPPPPHALPRTSACFPR